ncbi:MAG TPA: carboxyl transferase domain-containing protein, partial [Acidimicrobiales bacterium]
MSDRSSAGGTVAAASGPGVADVGPSAVALRGRVPGTTTASVVPFGPDGRRVVLVRVDPSQRRGALDEEDSTTIATAARLAHDQRLAFVGVVATSGADVHDGVAALHGWGTAARALARCSGVVPVLFAVVGPALSGPALLLGMADVVAMTSDAVAFVSGPAAVAEMTGLRL